MVCFPFPHCCECIHFQNFITIQKGKKSVKNAKDTQEEHSTKEVTFRSCLLWCFIIACVCGIDWVIFREAEKKCHHCRRKQRYANGYSADCAVCGCVVHRTLVQCMAHAVCALCGMCHVFCVACVVWCVLCVARIVWCSIVFVQWCGVCCVAWCGVWYVGACGWVCACMGVHVRQSANGDHYRMQKERQVLPLRRQLRTL